MKHTVKLMILAACAVVTASAFCACDARDGRVDDNSGSSVIMNENNRTTRTESRRTTSRMTAPGNADSTHSGGVLHDTASMIGEVGDDIADGAQNIGSTINSKLENTFGDNSNDNNAMDNM